MVLILGGCELGLESCLDECWGTESSMGPGGGGMESFFQPEIRSWSLNEGRDPWVRGVPNTGALELR